MTKEHHRRFPIGARVRILGGKYAGLLGEVAQHDLTATNVSAENIVVTLDGRHELGDSEADRTMTELVKIAFHGSPPKGTAVRRQIVFTEWEQLEVVSQPVLSRAPAWLTWWQRIRK